MAKVIGFDKSVEKQITCRKCSAIVTYVPNEIVKRYIKDYGGGGDTWKYIQCPNCGNEITV